MRSVLVITFFCVSLGLSGCSLLGKNLESPQVEVQSVAVNHVSSGRIWLDLTLNIKNPNSVDFTVNELEYFLLVSDKEVASEKRTEPIKIAAEKETFTTLPIELKVSDIITSALTLITEKSLPYQARGQVKVGPFKIPFNESGTLKIEDL